MDPDFVNDIFPLHCGPHNYVPAIIDKKKRIVAFGDIHGDYRLAINLLTSARLIAIKNDKIVWIGGDTYVVQVGDQLDSCRPTTGIPCNTNDSIYDESSDIAVMKLFNDLNLQAIKVGGSVISLLGNHEILNVLGNMDYVSSKGISEFENYARIANGSNTKKYANGLDARKYAFKPGNEFGKLLGCTRMPAVIIGSNLFVHAGIISSFVRKYGLDRNKLETINISIRKWLLGLIKDEEHVEYIIKYSNDSIFWTRILGEIRPGVSLADDICANNVSTVLKTLAIDNIIVGHTPQYFVNSNEANSTCDNHVWRIDTASSYAFHRYDHVWRMDTASSYAFHRHDHPFMSNNVIHNSRRAQYLEILNDNEFYLCDQNYCKKQIDISKISSSVDLNNF